MLLLLACADSAVDSKVDETGAIDSVDSGGPAALDPFTLAGEVDEDRIAAAITALEGFGTRYTGTAGNDQSRAWLISEFEALGLDTEEDPFADGVNVIARYPGATNPDRVWLFSAHYDSTSELAPEVAPGADDNASGVAAVLEAARILTAHTFTDSIWFVATGAEEQGSLGSAHLVDVLADEGVTGMGAIAPDMIGYWPLGDGDAFDILGDDVSEPLVTEMASVADELGVANKTWVKHNYCYGDDHTNFQDAGIPAISPMDCVEAHNVPSSGEDDPHYHRSTDTIDNVYLPFTARVTEVIVVSLARWAGPT